MLNHALRYLKMGLNVIPLLEKGKTPLIPWKVYQERRATEKEIKEWWTVAPNANIGIVTGAISGVAVVDLDGPEGLASASELGLTSTLESGTGKGKHLWYRTIENLANSVRSQPGIDIRGEAGYVVAPPSVHPNGMRYRWSRPVFAGFVAKLPLFPSTLFAKTSSNSMVPVVHNEEDWIASALKEMKDGNIDDTLFRICSKLRATGFSSDDAFTLLQPHAIRVGAEEGHLEAKIENVWNRYEPNKRENKMRLHKSNEQSFLLPSNRLVIHSPTNTDSWKQFEQRSMETARGDVIKTGYAKLDTLLIGGIKSSRLFTVAARTGVGKTNWLLATAKQICRSGKIVLLFSTEMPYEDIWKRYINSLEDPEEFREHKFYVCDSFAPNLEKIEEVINEIKPDVFMMDHINHVSEEHIEIANFMQGLNLLRRKYDCAGIISAQLNRSADWVDLKTGEKVIPRMSMVKGSGTIEQASSRVLLLSETRVTSEGTEIVGNLEKNDNGPKGMVHFMLKTNPYRMEEI